MNLKLLNFALGSIRRHLWQRLLVYTIFTTLVFLLISIFSISGALQAEQLLTLDDLPELTVQKMRAGRQVDIPIDRSYEIETIPGVAQAYPRVWGYYSPGSSTANLTLVGVDFALASYKHSFNDAILLIRPDIDSLGQDFYLAGQGAHDLLKEYGYGELFSLYSADGERIALNFAGTFSTRSSFESHDVILTPEENLRKLFKFNPYLATDITVRVPNQEEIETVKRKIQYLYPDCRIISRPDLEAAYHNLFDYRAGVFLALMISAFMSFFTLILDKGSGISLDEQQEIGIMKAVGWSIHNVLSIKLFESMYIALFAYMSGLTLSYFFVFVLDAPVLRMLFTGASVLKPEFQLIPYIDLQLLMITFLAIVPIYVFASIIPAWRSAIIDADEVMR